MVYELMAGISGFIAGTIAYYVAAACLLEAHPVPPARRVWSDEDRELIRRQLRREPILRVTDRRDH